MGKYTTYVGMDVHARSIDAQAMNIETGEHFRKTFTGCPSAAHVAEWLATLPQPVYCAYESGCTGFWMARGLNELGFACDVIAVSTLPKSTKDKQRKCDKLDAKAILREVANPASDHTTVWIPDERTEAERDLVRAYRIAVDTAKRAKQRLLAFLQRHGHVWCEKTKTGRRKKAWTRDFEAWLGKISFSEDAAGKAFEAYRRQVRDACQEARELKALVRGLAALPEHKPYVDALACLKGLEVESAMLARAEFGVFSRFDSGRKTSCWLGTVPSNGSSGPKESHGRITKAGNKHLRRSLVEGCSGIAAWTSGRKAVPKGADVSAPVQAIAAKANVRLHERHAHLRERGVNANKAKVAVVNELVRWIWAIGCAVEREQANA